MKLDGFVSNTDESRLPSEILHAKTSLFSNLLDFFLTGAEISLSSVNSANWGNLINH